MWGSPFGLPWMEPPDPSAPWPLISILLVVMIAPCFFTFFQERIGKIIYPRVSKPDASDNFSCSPTVACLSDSPSLTSGPALRSPSSTCPHLARSSWMTTVVPYHQEKAGTLGPKWAPEMAVLLTMFQMTVWVQLRLNSD